MADLSERARRWRLTGRVQGVGFRPFVYRLAHAHGLRGWVRNTPAGVEIHGQGSPEALAAFERDLLAQPPPLARPRLLAVQEVTPEMGGTGFAILASLGDEAAQPGALPPDLFACAECLAEMDDPADRRHGYPFINCTQCGPRYTLIARLPYDRPHTAMAGFDLCPDCQREYDDPLDRRFHAQPLACPACGPVLRFRRGGTEIQGPDALAATVEALRAGAIVAVKGIGGYHLLADATDSAVVTRLRQRKPRPHKPLAVMVPPRGADGLDGVRAIAAPEPIHFSLLRDPLRPIVLVPKRDDAPLAPEIAPGLNEIGVMLPYSPLHHRLLDAFGGPLLATSANVSEEPVLTDGAVVERRLGHLAEAFLHHNRPILRPADDPVLRVAAGRALPMRLGRGNAPWEGHLPKPMPVPMLALGGQHKNTLALAWGERVVVSPHIGDLETPRGLEIFQQVGEDLQRLYGVRAEALVHDLHPGYDSTRWARQQGLPLLGVGHHRAHASALAGEHDPNTTALIFVWDAIGWGEDGHLWGGEGFLGQPGAWQRVATMRPFRLPGGEMAARQPWRSALGLCWEAGLTWPDAPSGLELLHQAWQKGMNAPRTHGVGRLLDGLAALIGVASESTFEGQAPMGLEARARGGEPWPLPLVWEGPLLVWSWEPLLSACLEGSRRVDEKAGMVHASLAHVLLAQAEALRQRHGVSVVGLSGGVFQNRLLIEQAQALLASHGFQVWLAREIPCNDGGLAYGQAVEAAASGGVV